MTRAMGFLAREHGEVTIVVAPAAAGGYTATIKAAGVHVSETASSADLAASSALAVALSQERRRHRAELAHAESQAEAAREALAAIAEMEEG